MASLHMSEVLLQKPYQVYKADNGGIRFLLTFAPDAANLGTWRISLFHKECPHKLIYMIIFKHESALIGIYKDEDVIFQSDMPHNVLYLENNILNCWLTWNCDIIQIGEVKGTKCQIPFFVFKDPNPGHRLIGFVKFCNNNYFANLAVDTAPVFLKAVSHRKVEGGQLRWVKMTDCGTLPEDALIGGFENEPLYIARAMHNRSLCPGKYVRSKKKAFVPWGHNEHEKNIFEILCGYDAIWVKCKDNFVPENVFKAGTSEVRGEDIYIGRAMIDNNLIVGKVHMLYKTCYLPYQGREVEKYSYEILVTGNMLTHGVSIIKNCILNSHKGLQLCI